MPSTQTVGSFRSKSELKGKLGVIHIYFSKIHLHQRKYLVISVISKFDLVAEIFEKHIQNETTIRFLVGNINISISTN